MDCGGARKTGGAGTVLPRWEWVYQDLGRVPQYVTAPHWITGPRLSPIFLTRWAVALDPQGQDPGGSESCSRSQCWAEPQSQGAVSEAGQALPFPILIGPADGTKEPPQSHTLPPQGNHLTWTYTHRHHIQDTCTQYAQTYTHKHSHTEIHNYLQTHA